MIETLALIICLSILVMLAVALWTEYLDKITVDLREGDITPASNNHPWLARYAYHTMSGMFRGTILMVKMPGVYWEPYNGADINRWGDLEQVVKYWCLFDLDRPVERGWEVHYFPVVGA